VTIAEDIRQGARELGIEVPPAGADLVAAYVSLLEKWNQKIRLVAPCPTDELVQRHVVDCIALLPHLPESCTVVDVGSGGGLPSVIVAALRPNSEVTAIEPVAKKHSFLQAARRELALGNYNPVRGRDEDLFPEGADFDAATSRATFAVPEWLSRGRRLVRAGGLVLAMEGREQFALPAGARRHPYPLGDRQRSILVLEA
jgi:16S rRNA (guanine527-N7)-methyltransferase